MGYWLTGVYDNDISSDFSDEVIDKTFVLRDERYKSFNYMLFVMVDIIIN